MKKDSQFINALIRDFKQVLSYAGNFNESMFAYKEIAQVVSQKTRLKNNFFLKNIAGIYHHMIIIGITRQLERLIELLEKAKNNYTKTSVSISDISIDINRLELRNKKLSKIRNKIIVHIPA